MSGHVGRLARKSFDGFAAVARARQHLFVWLENMYVDEGLPRILRDLKAGHHDQKDSLVRQLRRCRYDGGRHAERKLRLGRYTHFGGSHLYCST